MPPTQTLQQVIARAHREEAIQAYLTRTPQVLPVALGLPRVWTKGGPDGAGSATFQVAKLRLGSQYVTDFAIVVCRSLHLEIVLVELEPASARPFTKAGSYAKRLNDAFRQLNDWFAWLDRPENGPFFRRTVWQAAGLPDSVTRKYCSLYDPFTEYYYGKIIIGRRSMMTAADNARRGAIHRQTGARIEVMPYDRLIHADTMLRRHGFKNYEQRFRARFRKAQLAEMQRRDGA